MSASWFASWRCYIKVSKGCSRYIHINTHTQHDTHIWEMLIVLFPLSPFFRGRRHGRQPLNTYIYIYPMCVPIIVGHSPIPVYPLFRSHYISPFEATSVMAANKEEDPLARAWLEVFPVQKWKSWGILVKKTNPKFGKFLGNFGNSLDVMFLYVF